MDEILIKKLKSKVVFLSKQVSNRDKIIKQLEESLNLKFKGD